MAKNYEINLTPEEVRAICKEYEFNEEEDMMGDEKLYKAKKALTYLERSDYIIYCLYLNYQSERKVASLLGISRTPVARILKEINKQLQEIVSTL